jgi:TetR/AcrR family transcriptional repressor of mexJK operon
MTSNGIWVNSHAGSSRCSWSPTFSACADRFPELGRTWYEQGFERALATTANAFQALTDRGLLILNNPQRAADHFVGMLLWIPVNIALFTGDDDYCTRVELAAYAHGTVRAFVAAYGGTRQS